MKNISKEAIANQVVKLISNSFDFRSGKMVIEKDHVIIPFYTNLRTIDIEAVIREIKTIHDNVDYDLCDRISRGKDLPIFIVSQNPYNPEVEFFTVMLKF